MTTTKLLGLLTAAVMVAGAVAVAVARPATASTSALYAWGDNSFGQVGNGTTSPAVADPYIVGQLGGSVVQTAGGFDFSLALLADGSVWAWGDNAVGELGDGSLAAHLTPRPVANLHNIVQIAAGPFFGLAVQADGSLWAWGDNGSGQLGNGTRNDALVPAKLASPAGVVQVAAGFHHSVALRSNGEVWAWGSDYEGQVGTGRDLSDQDPAHTDRLTPVRTLAPYGVVQVAAAANRTMALRSAPLGGGVFTWGSNLYGALGDGTTATTSTPKLVLRSATTIGLGDIASYAVGADGFLYAWGSNLCGVLGDGTAVAEQHRPERVNFTGVTQVDGGFETAVAVRSDGTLWWWGVFGPQPCGAVDPPPTSSSPVQLQGLSSVAQVSLSTENTYLAVAAAPPPPATTIVPELTGQDLDQASGTLRAAGLTLGGWSGREDRSCRFIDKVMGSTPPAGTEVATGSAVSVTLGEHPTSTECP